MKHSPIRRTNARGVDLAPDGLAGVDAPDLGMERLHALSGRSVVGHGDLDRDAVIALCRLAARMEQAEIAESHPLDGKLVITAFFEASTRTRLSFESAVLRLDGKVISVADGKVTGAAKGESLADMGEMFNSYGDLLVVRHPRTEAVEELQTYLRLPMINAGNGTGEHPTQALVDWYALLKWRPQLMKPEPEGGDRLHLGIIGTPGNMRAVKSFMFQALAFAPHLERVTVISEMADPFGAELRAALDEASLRVEVTNDATEVIEQLDVVYMNSITLLGDSYKELDSRYKINANTRLKPGAVVMHPLARRDELDPALDDTEHNLYFAQAAGAVYVRQALLATLLGRLDRLPEKLRR